MPKEVEELLVSPSVVAEPSKLIDWLVPNHGYRNSQRRSPFKTELIARCFESEGNFDTRMMLLNAAYTRLNRAWVSDPQQHFPIVSGSVDEYLKSSEESIEPVIVDSSYIISHIPLKGPVDEYLGNKFPHRSLGIYFSRNAYVSQEQFMKYFVSLVRLTNTLLVVTGLPAFPKFNRDTAPKFQKPAKHF